jgi:hypothetical protein
MTFRHPYFTRFNDIPTPQAIQSEYIQPPAYPVIRQQTVNPTLPANYNPFWISYLKPPAFPAVSVRIEVPYGPPPNPYWTYKLNPPSYPTVQQRTEVPISPTINPFWINYLNPPAYPTILSRTELPPIGGTSNPYYILGLNPNLVVVINPKVIQQTTNPTLSASPTNPYYTSFIIPVGQDLLPFRTDTRNPVLPILIPKDWSQSLSLPNFQVITLPYNQYNWPNPGIPLRSPQDWINFLTNIPPPLPPPPGPIGGGRYITEREVQEALHKLYTHKPTPDTVHSIAQALGKLGGIKSGISRRRR